MLRSDNVLQPKRDWVENKEELQHHREKVCS